MFLFSIFNSKNDDKNTNSQKEKTFYINIYNPLKNPKELESIIHRSDRKAFSEFLKKIVLGEKKTDKTNYIEYIDSNEDTNLIIDTQGNSKQPGCSTRKKNEYIEVPHIIFELKAKNAKDALDTLTRGDVRKFTLVTFYFNPKISLVFNPIRKEYVPMPPQSFSLSNLSIQIQNKEERTFYISIIDEIPLKKIAININPEGLKFWFKKISNNIKDISPTKDESGRICYSTQNRYNKKDEIMLIDESGGKFVKNDSASHRCVSSDFLRYTVIEISACSPEEALDYLKNQKIEHCNKITLYMSSGKNISFDINEIFNPNEKKLNFGDYDLNFIYK